MKFWWILDLLAAVGIVAAVPPINDFLGIHTLDLDNRTSGAAIHPPPKKDGGCGSQPQSKLRFYNSATKGECDCYSWGFTTLS